MQGFAGRVAAVTGAASGIGRALARELAGRGCALALADVDAKGLSAVAEECCARGVAVTSRVVDVADRAAVFAWADAVAAEHGRVNLVVNNAGVALVAPVASMALDDLEWLFGVNFWGVVHGTKAFLPHLEAAGEGHVVNVSSVFGLVGVPSQAAYSAAKFAVRGFTEALRVELEARGSGVSATVVHPGGVRTGIARRARVDPAVSGGARRVQRDFERVARTSPERAARRILRGVERNERRVLVGADALAIDLLARMPAGLYQRVMAAVYRRVEG
jgi:short-subunit dehydrogenase